MNTKNNLLLISNDEELSKNIYEKLVLLRNKDTVITLDYDAAVKQIKTIYSNIIIVHEHQIKNKTLNLITDLKDLDKNNERDIILITNSDDQEFILKAYDEGICDHFYKSSKDFEILLKIINCIKNNVKNICYNRNRKLLEQIGVIDDITGLYKYQYAEQIINTELDNSKNSNGIFMALSPEENGKTTFSLHKMTNALKESVRTDDILIQANGVKTYLYLKNTDLHGAAIVLNKIKDIYESDFKIKAGICDVKYKDFIEIEKEALSALGEAMLTKEEFIFYQEKENDTNSWLDIDETDESVKNFKLFKQSYAKKLERVVVPVFYRLQKAYEEKLFNTKIEQYTEENESVFYLKNENQTSRLKLVYPGFAKIIIYITHEGLNSPENKEITLPLKKVDQKILVSILEAFIKEFKTTLK